MEGLRVVLAIAVWFGAISLCASPVWAQGSDSGYRVFRPEGPGPYPAVAFVSGCSGFTPSVAPRAYERVAQQFQAQGFIVIFVDYLARRGLQSCVRAPITPEDAGKDLVAATGWLQSQPFVDKTQIIAIGWSYGGGAVLAALADHSAEQLAFSRAVVYYPSCQTVRPWKVATPVLMLLAADDDVTPAKMCQEAVPKNAPPGAVKIVTYRGALHAFDVSELPAKTRYPLGTLGYHPQAAAAAWEEIQVFLKAGR
jgi:dienelactone hydrolase